MKMLSWFEPGVGGRLVCCVGMEKVMGEVEEAVVGFMFVLCR